MPFRRPGLAITMVSTLAAWSCAEAIDPAGLDPSAVVVGTAVTAEPGGVRINEIHYDNDGTDTGEAIEIAGPAGTDLAGWTVVLYNGSSTTREPYDTRTLTGPLPTTCALEGGGSEGVVVLDYPTNGIQNGSPDGVALVDAGGTVVEFLSYEGTFEAASGPAAGLTSTDIGVAESGSTPVGHSLQRDAAGVFGAAAEASFGACNPEGGGGDGGDGGDGGNGGGDGDPSDLYLAELHYDNAGTDAGEFVEVAGPSGTDLSGWSVVLYNGSNGAAYDAIELSGTLGETCEDGTGVAAFPRAGIQNGAPDGLALVTPAGDVVEFLSYEGSFAAADGPAAGTTSTDIGVAETSSTPLLFSLQRNRATREWNPPAAETPGACNPSPTPGAAFLSEIRADQPGGDSDEYFELGGDPALPLIGFAYVVLGDASDDNGGVVEAVVDLGGSSLGAGGAFVAAEASFTLGTADLVTTLDFENNDNPTHMLVWGFSGALGDDLDTDNDGVLETAPWVELVDCLSLIEFLGLGPVYCDARIGRDESFTPGHATRLDGGWISDTFTPPSGDTPGTLEFDPAAAVAGMIAPWGVGDPGVVTSISASASFVPLPVGFNRALFFTAFDDFRTAVDVALSFSSSDAGVVSVDQFGNLTAEATGGAVVTAEAPNGVSTGVDVLVVADVASGVAFQDHTTFGTPADGSPADDIVLRRDEFDLSYNAARGGPNWVAWNLDAAHFGGTDRCECYTPDPALPAGVVRVVNFDFTGSGYSRGHMTQSFNRTVTLPDNAATYYTTNILPQAAANNGGPWGDFESFVNGRAFAGEEVYVIAGGEWGGAPPTLKDEGRVQVPDFTWKVAVFLGLDETLADAATFDDLEVIAIRTPNRVEPGVPGTVDGIDGDWETYRVEVDEIEARTGYDLLALLSDEVEIAVESGFVDVFQTLDALTDAGDVSPQARAALRAALDQALKRLVKGSVEQALARLDTALTLIDAFEANGQIAPDAAALLRAEVEAFAETLTV